MSSDMALDFLESRFGRPRNYGRKGSRFEFSLERDSMGTSPDMGYI